MSISFEPAQVIALLEAARHTTPTVPSVGPSAEPSEVLDDETFAEQLALRAAARVHEAGSDDHFYGPWFGGSAAAGGGPGRGKTLEARKADMASKVGAANVGNPNPTSANAEGKDELPRPPGFDREGGPRISIRSDDPRKGGPEDPRQTHYRFAESGAWVQKGDHKEYEVHEWKKERVDSVHKPYYESVVGGGLPKSDVPTVYMTGGGPASGKSSGLIDNPAAGIPGKGKSAHVDPDSAKTHIPEYNAGLKRRDKTAANTVHEESSHLAKTGVKVALGRQHDVVYDSVGDTGIEKLEKKVATFRAQGATNVRAEYATVPIAVAQQRAYERATTKVWPDGTKNPDYGRFVAKATIDEAHRDVSRTFQAAVERGIFDHARLWDTNIPKGTAPSAIVTYDKAKGGLTVHNQKAWDAFKAIGQESD